LRSDPDFEASAAEADTGLVEAGELDALVTVHPPPAGDRSESGSAVVFFLATIPSSAEARRRLEPVLDEYRGRLLADRFAALGSPLDPRQEVQATALDLADPVERAGSFLSRLL